MAEYGGYTSENLDHWEQLPIPSNVLTSSAFGAWLMRRDENRDKALGLVERSKIDKAINKLKQYSESFVYTGRRELVVTVDNCIDILKRNIGE